MDSRGRRDGHRRFGGVIQVCLRIRSSADQETRLIGRLALYAFLLNLGLAAMKGILAFYSSSLAVTAGAIDSGTDAVASLILYGGLKLSTHKTLPFRSAFTRSKTLFPWSWLFSSFLPVMKSPWQVIRPHVGRPGNLDSHRVVCCPPEWWPPIFWPLRDRG